MSQAALFSEPHAQPSCVLSECKRYRYTLRIPIAHEKERWPRVCLFVMANPSTAIVQNGTFTSDPTVTRCLNFARAWGCTELIVENVRAWRETDPSKVPADPLAIGPENDSRIHDSAFEADLVVCAWGKLGGERGVAVLRALREFVCDPMALKINADGSPAHPLYLAANLKPITLEDYAIV